VAVSSKTEAVVLRKLRYGEADSILHLYTREHGRVNAIAKGARKSASRFGGRLEPLFRVELMLHEGRGDLATVTGAATIDGFSGLRTSHVALSAAAAGCDAVLRLLDARERNEPAYNLLCNFLTLADRHPAQAGPALVLAFRLKLLLVAGFAPELGACATCAAGDRLTSFSAKAGGLVCDDCADEGFAIGEAAATFMREALGRPLAEAPSADAATLREVDRAIRETAEYHAHVRMRAVG
jgi:DNA repair protein RecO (recombination protein O)